MTDADIGFFDANCRVDPPFRSQKDRTAIRMALADGTIDAICSDHAPVDEDAKLLPFGEAEPGVTAVELLLPLTLKWASETGHTLSEALARITCAPARLLNGPVCGRLGVGTPADICVFDRQAHWTVEPNSLRSQGKNTPFIGYEVAGRVTMTLVGGEVRYGAAR
jgi:dihydroorotase